MSRPVSNGAFGNQCAVVVSNTFIDIRCLDEKNTNSLRRRKSDPLCSYATVHSHSQENEIPVCPKWGVEVDALAPSSTTSTTFDECSDKLTPTSCDDCRASDTTKDDESYGEAFSWADAANPDLTSFEVFDDATPAQPQFFASARNSYEFDYSQYLMPQGYECTGPQVPWQSNAVLSTGGAVEYQWTGDASSRTPYTPAPAVVQDQQSNDGVYNIYASQLENQALGAPAQAGNGQYGYYKQPPQPPPPPPKGHHGCFYPIKAEAEPLPMFESETTTTVMVRNLQEDIDQFTLVEQFVERGYQGVFDFVYMPMNLRRCGNFGYAFVNFVSHQIATQFMTHMQDMICADGSDEKKWDIVWSTCQGFAANVERYRNSPLMHDLVPNQCKPAVYDEHGNQVTFPHPTKTIPKPRIHWPGPKEPREIADTHGPKSIQGSIGNGQPERCAARNNKKQQRHQVKQRM